MHVVNGGSLCRKFISHLWRRLQAGDLQVTSRALEDTMKTLRDANSFSSALFLLDGTIWTFYLFSFDFLSQKVFRESQKD